MRFILAATAAVSMFAIAAPAVADTSGLVRGIATLAGKPAPGAVITLSGEGTTQKTTADAKGAFVFARVPFGRYTVTFTSGDATASQAVDIESDTVADLRLDARPLREIARTASGLVKGAGSTPVSVNAIGRAQISALPDNQSLNNLIETFPGIVRFSYNEPVAHGFHGLTYELDGVPLPQGTTSNFSEVVDPRSIDSLEVFTGAFPAEFGGSRQGAVVNIISHRATDLASPQEGSLTLGAGTYGDAQTSLAESLRAGNTRIFFNANVERTDRGIDSPTFDPIHDNSNSTNQFLRTITNVGARDSLTFDVSNSNSAFQIPINTSVTPYDSTVFPPGTDDVQREYDRFINVAYTNNSASGNAYTQIAPWYRYDRVVYAGDTPNDLAAGTDGLQQDRRSEFEGLRITHFHVYGANAIKLGVDGSIENFLGSEQIAYYNVDANGNPTGPVQNFFDNQAQRGTQVGAYIQDKWTPTQYVSLLGGVRYDHSTGYVAGAQLSPRIEFNGQLDPQDIFHAYYGRLYAAPFLEDTRRAAVIVGGGGNAALPAYTLQPEHDSYYEFGLAHTFAQGARATINFWKRDVRNVLDTQQLANTPIFAVFNNTIGIAKGVEGRVDARFRNGDSFFLSTTLSQALAGGISGSTFLFCPTNDPSCLQGASDVTLNPEDHDQTFETNLGYTKRLGRDHSFYATVEPEYGTGYPVQFQNGSGRLPPHLTFDAAVGRDATRGSKPALGFAADFTNIANTKYLLKVNNGFNTTQWGPGFRADVRVIAPF